MTFLITLLVTSILMIISKVVYAYVYYLFVYIIFPFFLFCLCSLLMCTTKNVTVGGKRNELSYIIRKNGERSRN